MKVRLEQLQEKLSLTEHAFLEAFSKAPSEATWRAAEATADQKSFVFWSVFIEHNTPIPRIHYNFFPRLY